jgi:enterochelin esterase-like enzyme/sugar lactone lactonase YvrE
VNKRLYTSLNTLFVFAFLLMTVIGRSANAEDDYKIGPDSEYQPGVPRGKVTHHTWASKIFPGTLRDYWVYVPQQYDPKSPACVMIFQDGGGFQDTGGGFRVPIVFDNLIYKKQMPVTIGIFIDPGVVPAASPNALPRYNRSFEYDSPTDRYARFLLEEILPEIGKQYNLTREAGGRAICGASSGGICAFAAAWERPDQFSRVMSFVGSFTHLQGAHNLAPLIRKIEPKPIRVFLQDGANDQDIYAGSWFLGNQEMAAALKFAGYDVQFVVGDGRHSGTHGRAILPDALRWLWRDYPAPIRAATESRQPVMNHIVPGEDWQWVGPRIEFADQLTTDAAGNVYVSDSRNGRIYRVEAETGAAKVWKEKTGGASALTFGPDGRLYACVPNRRRIVAFNADGKVSEVSAGIAAAAMVVNHQGGIYCADGTTEKIWYLDPNGRKTIVDTGMPDVTGIALTPDQSLLVVTQGAPGKFAYSYAIKPDGSLTDKQEYFDLYVPYGLMASGAGGMTTDTQGWVYAASIGGVQILDQAGRVNSIIANPQRTPTTSVAFGGTRLDTLFAVAEGKLYRRKLKVKGVLPSQAPIKPPGPRL